MQGVGLWIRTEAKACCFCCGLVVLEPQTVCHRVENDEGNTLKHLLWPKQCCLMVSVFCIAKPLDVVWNVSEVRRVILFCSVCSLGFTPLQECVKNGASCLLNFRYSLKISLIHHCP